MNHSPTNSSSQLSHTIYCIRAHTTRNCWRGLHSLLPHPLLLEAAVLRVERGACVRVCVHACVRACVVNCRTISVSQATHGNAHPPLEIKHVQEAMPSVEGMPRLISYTRRERRGREGCVGGGAFKVACAAYDGVLSGCVVG